MPLLPFKGLLGRSIQLARRIVPWPNRFRFPLFRHRLPVRVNPETALTISAVWACVNFIAGSIGQLPWGVYRPLTGNPRRGGEFISDNPVTWVLNHRASTEMGAFDFRATMLYHVLIYGNGYAEIERDRAGRVKNLWLLEPDRVEVDRDRETGQLIYRVANVNGPVILQPKDVFHLKGMGFDGLVGYPVIEYAARTMGLSIAAEEYGTGFFGNSGVPSAVVQHPKTLRDKAMRRLEEQLKTTMRGPYKSQDTLILEEGMEFKLIGLPPEQAQFLETRKINIDDVARWFGVPPSKIGHFEKISYNSAEQLALDVISDCLMPWVKKLEQEADYKLLNDRFGGLYSKINLRAFMRATHADRAKYYKDMFSVGAYSPNDIRELEDENPIEHGDTYFVPVNNVAPLELAATGQALPAGGAASQPTSEPEPPAENTEGEEEEKAEPEQAQIPGRVYVDIMRERIVDDLLLIEDRRNRERLLERAAKIARSVNGSGDADRSTAH